MNQKYKLLLRLKNSIPLRTVSESFHSNYFHIALGAVSGYTLSSKVTQTAFNIYLAILIFFTVWLIYYVDNYLDKKKENIFPRIQLTDKATAIAMLIFCSYSLTQINLKDIWTGVIILIATTIYLLVYHIYIKGKNILWFREIIVCLVYTSACWLPNIEKEVLTTEEKIVWLAHLITCLHNMFTLLRLNNKSFSKKKIKINCRLLFIFSGLTVLLSFYFLNLSDTAYIALLILFAISFIYIIISYYNKHSLAMSRLTDWLLVSTFLIFFF